MVEIIRNKWCDDLEDLLQCPICMVRPKTWIYQCVQGHHICEDCKTQLSLCPTCSQRWSTARNRLAESLCAKLDDIKLSLIDPESEINKLLIPDRVSVASQTEAEGAAALPSGKKASDDPFGAFPCCVSGCNVKLLYAPLMKHLQADHPSQYIQLPMGEGPVFHHVWFFDFIEQMMFDRAFIVPNMGTFFLKLSSDCFGNLSGFVLMMNNGFVAKQFTYQLEIACCAEHSTSKMYNGEICSSRTPPMVLNEKCLQIKRADVQQMIDHQKMLTCTVLIGKKPQTENQEAASKSNYPKKKYPANKKNPARPQNQPPRPPQNRPLPGPSNQQPNNRQSRPQSASNGQYGQPVVQSLRDMSLQSRHPNRNPPSRAGSIPSLLYPDLRDIL